MPGAAIAPTRRRGADVSGDSALPGVLADIERATSRRVAIVVALAFGGQDIHIPSEAHLRRHPHHPLAHAVGLDSAILIGRRLSGGSAYVPRARKACAVQLTTDGLSIPEISARLGISASAARRYSRQR